MKYLISFFIFILSQNLFAEQYQVNCLSEGNTPFFKSIIVSGDLLTSDSNNDGEIDHINGDLTIEFPYLSFSQKVKVDGEAVIDDYIKFQYLYSKPRIIHTDSNLGHFIEIVESEFRGGPFIRITYNFEPYKCIF